MSARPYTSFVYFGFMLVSDCADLFLLVSLQYSTDCSMNGTASVTRTPYKQVTATGSCNQTVTPEHISRLDPGKYCYR